MKNWLYVFSFFALSSCGYRYVSQDYSNAKPVSITIPYILGDPDAIFNNELVYQLSSSGHFVCVQTDGDYILQATVLSDTQSRIGFRYDRDNVSGALEKNLLGVEDRRSVAVRVTVIESGSNKEVLGPFEMSANVDYDYIDPGSPKDLVFSKLSGFSESIIQFSLGQLDSYEGAYDDTSRLVFRKLAEKITAGLVNHLSEIR